MGGASGREGRCTTVAQLKNNREGRLIGIGKHISIITRKKNGTEVKTY